MPENKGIIRCNVILISPGIYAGGLEANRHWASAQTLNINQPKPFIFN